jgi:hypothetical protein
LNQISDSWKSPFDSHFRLDALTTAYLDGVSLETLSQAGSAIANRNFFVLAANSTVGVETTKRDAGLSAAVIGVPLSSNQKAVERAALRT